MGLSRTNLIITKTETRYYSPQQFPTHASNVWCKFFSSAFHEHSHKYAKLLRGSNPTIEEEDANEN